ncbi:MAG: restriction endonuclease subunit S [Bacteriovorax sp.]|nr:restriction endonuclease subunit S [Rhizobacter sp.]
MKGSDTFGWTDVSVGDICEFKYGKSLPEPSRRPGKVQVFGSNGAVGLHDQHVSAGTTLVVGRKGSFGEVHFSEEPCWPIDTTYYVDETCTDVDLRWLFHRLRSVGLKTLNRAAAVPGLNRDDAYRQRLLLPPLPEQRRIADVLDRAETVRAQRRQALAQLDALAEAIFLDMFGDPISNSRRLPEGSLLGDVADVVSGITKGRPLKGQAARAVPYLAVSNVQDRSLNLGVVKTIEATDAEIARYRLLDGDLLLTEGGDPDKLGRGTLWCSELPECIHQNHIFRVRVTSPNMRPLYLSWLVGSQRGKRYFLRSAKQTTGIASINMKQLKGFPLLTPSLDTQLQFERRLEGVSVLRMAHARAVVELDALFASLQHRAFRGEL